MTQNGPPPTVAAARLFWHLPTSDNRVSFMDLANTDNLRLLGPLLVAYDSTDGVKLYDRRRLPLEVVFSGCINDLVQEDDPVVGGSKHSWPLQTLHTGHLGGLHQRPEQMCDMPFFFTSEVQWSPEQVADYAQAKPIHRLGFTNAPDPWLWKDPDIPTLRVRTLRPTEMLHQRVIRYQFRIKGGLIQPGTPTANKMIIILCMEGTLVAVTLQDILSSTFRPKPGNFRGSVGEWIRTVALEQPQQQGPILIERNIVAGHLVLDWLFTTSSDVCRQWRIPKVIGQINSNALGGALLGVLRTEMNRGPAGQAVPWGDLYDIMMDGT